MLADMGYAVFAADLFGAGIRHGVCGFCRRPVRCRHKADGGNR
jgi:hypothetical protein